MRLKSLILGFSIIPPTVIALQMSVIQDSRIFISKDKMWCGQAQADVAKNALSLYKSMPRGKLYEGVTINDTGDSSCEELGYTFSQAEDMCYPGLQASFRNEEERDQFLAYFRVTLNDYGDRFNFTFNETSLLDACKCKNNSVSIKYWGKACERATQLQALIEHGDTSVTNLSATHTFVSMDKMWCGQAKAGVAEDALSLYKSMPRGKLYEGVLVTDSGNCEDLGYTFGQGEDPCYPGLQMSFRNEGEKNQFLNSFHVTLKKFSEKHNFSFNDTSLLDACACKEGSYAINYWGQQCERMTQLRMLSRPVPLRTFVSMNKKFCAQARPRVAEGALALFKAMPRGKLYADTLIHINDSLSCEDRGYKQSAGEDPCYPGLQTFYRNEEEKIQFVHDLSTALNEFAVRYNLTSNDANLMDSCTCHVDSFALKYRGKSCSVLDNVEASWVHREPNTDKKIACAGGPFALATRALAVLKTAEELPMHKMDQIAPVNCEAFGFPFRFASADACFTGIHAWTATRDAVHDTLNEETKRVLSSLLNGGFKNFTKVLRLDNAVFGHNSQCKCSPKSQIGKKAKRKCDVLGARNHIRDWWKD